MVRVGQWEEEEIPGPTNGLVTILSLRTSSDAWQWFNEGMHKRFFQVRPRFVYGFYPTRRELERPAKDTPSFCKMRHGSTSQNTHPQDHFVLKPSEQDHVLIVGLKKSDWPQW